jgi:hypothetical protein
MKSLRIFAVIVRGVAQAFRADVLTLDRLPLREKRTIFSILNLVLEY